MMTATSLKILIDIAMADPNNNVGDDDKVIAEFQVATKKKDKRAYSSHVSGTNWSIGRLTSMSMLKVGVSATSRATSSSSSSL